MPSVLTLGGWLAAQGQVNPSQADAYDLQLAACQVLDFSRAQLIAHPEHQLDETLTSTLDRFATRLHAGEPLAYLFGSKEFWSLELQVSPAVLIPRPETELLVELALTKARLQQSHNPTQTIVELGTGSGAISLALASELSRDITLIATDYSADAIATAQANAKRLNLNVNFVQADWLAPFTTDVASMDLLISNPPYVAANDPHLPALSFEPLSALVSGEDGLDDIRHICMQAATTLRPGGWLLLEHGYDQGEAVRQLLQHQGFRSTSTEADLAGLDRVTLGQQPNSADV